MILQNILLLPGLQIRKEQKVCKGIGVLLLNAIKREDYYFREYGSKPRVTAKTLY